MLGKPHVSKSDEFSEKFRKGGGSFLIQKFILQNLDLSYALLSQFCREIRNITFRKWGGGSKAVWNFSENSSDLETWGIPKAKRGPLLWSAWYCLPSKGQKKEGRGPRKAPNKTSRWSSSLRRCQTTWAYKSCPFSRFWPQVLMSISICTNQLQCSWLLSGSADKTVQLWEAGDNLQPGWSNIVLIRDYSTTNQGSPTSNNKPFAQPSRSVDTSWRYQ